MDRILNLINSSRSLGPAIRRVHTRTANFKLLRGGLRRMEHLITVREETDRQFLNFFGRSRTSTAKMSSQTRTANFDKIHLPELMIKASKNFILRNDTIFTDLPRSS